MNTKPSTSASTSGTPQIQPPSSESTPTATGSPSTNSATQQDLLIRIFQKSSEIVESIDRMLSSVTALNQRASTRYTLTDSILTEQEREKIRLKMESNSSIRDRFLSRLGVWTLSGSYAITNGRKTRTASSWMNPSTTSTTQLMRWGTRSHSTKRTRTSALMRLGKKNFHP